MNRSPGGELTGDQAGDAPGAGASAGEPAVLAALAAAESARDRALTELVLREARISGLEEFVARGEEIAREAVERLALLLRELGVDVDPAQVPLWRLPELVAALRESIIPARNRLGELERQIRQLAEDAQAYEDERAQLNGRIRSLERALAQRSGERGGSPDDQLRILMVVHDFLPVHRGGTEIYTWRIAKALARRHQVHLVFTGAHPGLVSYRMRDGSFDGLPFTEISHQHVALSFERSWNDPRIDALFQQILDRVRPTVVHVQHLQHLSLGVVRMAKQAGVPVVYTLHDYALLCPRNGRMLPPDLERCREPKADRCAVCIEGVTLRDPHGDSGGFGGRLGRHIPDGVRDLLAALLPKSSPPPKPDDTAAERAAAITARLDGVRAAVTDVDLFISPSAFLRTIFVDAGLVPAEKIVVSENGQDSTPFHAVSWIPTRRYRVGYLGAVVAEKGVDVLVRALNHVIDLEDLEGHIHGSLDIDPRYGKRVVDECHNPRVKFHGAYEPARAAEILSTIDVLVVPSIWWENSPLTIQEAFLAGIPVIVSGIGGMAEKVIDGRDGLHFPPGDVLALAERLRRLHDDRVLGARLVANRPLIKSIEDDALNLEARYRHLIAAPGKS